MTAKGSELGGRRQPQGSATPQFPQLPPHVISKGTSGSERKQATTRQPRLRGTPGASAPTRGGGRGGGPRAGAAAWGPGVAAGSGLSGTWPLTWTRRRRRHEGEGGWGSSRRAPPLTRPRRPAPAPAGPAACPAHPPRALARPPGGRALRAGLSGSSPTWLVPPPPATRTGVPASGSDGQPRREARGVGPWPCGRRRRPAGLSAESARRRSAGRGGLSSDLGGNLPK